MASIDVRTEDSDYSIDEIVFGDEESLMLVSEESEVFYVKVGTKTVDVYLDSIDNMIKALEQAKEMWT